MERAASEDAFLAAAIDGLGALTPTAVDAVKVSDVSGKKRRLWWMIPVAIGAVAYGLMWFTAEDKPDPAPATSLPLSSEEVELKEEIDNWDAQESADVIKATQTDSSMEFTVRIPVTEGTEEPLKAESVSPRLESFVLFEIQVEDELRDEEPELFPSEESTSPEPPAYEHLMYELARFRVYSYKGQRDKKFDPLAVDHGGLSAVYSNPDEQSDRPPKPPQQMGYDVFLERAMMHFAEGRYKVADWHFEDILTTYGDDVNALFYSGLSNFHRGKYDIAQARFEASVYHDIGAFAEAAEFYLARTYLTIGEEDKARETLESIVEKDGFYGKQAREMLD